MTTKHAKVHFEPNPKFYAKNVFVIFLALFNTKLLNESNYIRVNRTFSGSVEDVTLTFT